LTRAEIDPSGDILQAREETGRALGLMPGRERVRDRCLFRGADAQKLACRMPDMDVKGIHRNREEPMSDRAKPLVGVNNNGVAMLGDNTRWRIAPGLVAAAAQWTLGARIAVEDNVHIFWKYRLVNTDNGEWVWAVPSQREF
jgi:hypothetical protein